MTAKITELSNKIARLERELLEELKQQEAQFRYTVKGKRVEFEYAILLAHRRLKIAILPWLAGSALRNAITAPLIYGMAVPLAFLDLTVTLYQHICFRLYGITRVKRADYVVIDRHQLAYLNGIEKFNCAYCGYGNGVIAYTREIISRTEQYWCPIKHARGVIGAHKRYNRFLDFGDADAYRVQRLEFREQLREGEPDS